jgi:UDP-N-acetylglucosamine:LPS N-acetylglucosamine transferase
MRSVLLLTAGFGEGHNAAARGLKEGFDVLGSMQAEILDLFAPAFGSLYERGRRDYLQVVNKTPLLWAGIYNALDLLPFAPQFVRLLRPLQRELNAVLAEKRPSAVVSVFPLYGYLLEAAAKAADLPDLKRFMLVTDSITIHSLWHRCGSDAFLVPNADTAASLRHAGVEAAKILVSGFPVSPGYAANTETRPAPGGGVQPRVLYVINGQPGRAVPLVERLLRGGGIELTVAAGKNSLLKANLETLAARMGKPARILGWVDDMPALLARNHLLIGKAGGATVQEALAAKTPMLITQILPGQEEGNARLLLQNGCGAHCPTNESVVSITAQLFSRDAAGWHRMHRHAAGLARPDAALTTARWIAEQCGGETRDTGAGFGLRPGPPSV